jgi:proteasome activator subunit 4
MGSSANLLDTSLALVPDLSAILGHDVESLQLSMEIEDESQLDTPSEELGINAAGTAEQTLLERQLAILQTYTDSVPYECESVEVMNDKLKGIVEKIILCAKVGDWVSLSHASNGLQWYETSC